MKKKKSATVFNGQAFGYQTYGGYPILKITSRRKCEVFIGNVSVVDDPRQLRWADNWPHRLERELRRLHEAEIVTYGDAAGKTRQEIEKIRRVGRDSIDHMEETLHKHNMWFKSDQKSFKFE